MGREESNRWGGLDARAPTEARLRSALNSVARSHLDSALHTG